MSGSEPAPDPKVRPTCTIIATSSFPGTEIELVAADKRVLGRSIQHLQLDVPAGIYIVRAILDRRSRDEIVDVEPGPPTQVTIEAPEIASPIPLDKTRTSHEYHQNLAEDLSRNDAEKLVLGAGAELLVMARQWNVDAGAAATPAVKPRSTLELCSKAGTRLLDYDAEGLLAIGGSDLGIGRTAKLDPSSSAGAYRLRVSDPKMPKRCRELALYAPQGWQLQVFVLARGEGGRVLDEDLTSAAITMRKIGQPFSRMDYDGHLVEAARRSLETRGGGLAADGAMLDQLLHDKFENLILGLVAAHAMHMRGQLDPSLLSLVASNLEKLLGPIPDVIALQLEANPDAVVPSIDLPPMLRASWSLLLDHSVDRPDLIPSTSFAAKIASRVVGSGAWLIWDAKREQPGLESMGLESMEPKPKRREISKDEDRRLAVRFFGVPSSLVDVVHVVEAFAVPSAPTPKEEKNHE